MYLLLTYGYRNNHVNYRKNESIQMNLTPAINMIYSIDLNLFKVFTNIFKKLSYFNVDANNILNEKYRKRKFF